MFLESSDELRDLLDRCCRFNLVAPLQRAIRLSGLGALGEALFSEFTRAAPKGDRYEWSGIFDFLAEFKAEMESL